MGALTPVRRTASSTGAVIPITGLAATAIGLPYLHTITSTNGTDKSDGWVASGCIRKLVVKLRGERQAVFSCHEATSLTMTCLLAWSDGRYRNRTITQ